jgi:hypothetical protein
MAYLEQENSNFTGLDYSLGVFNFTAVYRLHQKIFLRGNLRWQRKNYSGIDDSQQPIGIDPEIGEGNNGNFDVLYTFNKNISFILRTNFLNMESTFRNIYYSKKIIELMLEFK